MVWLKFLSPGRTFIIVIALTTCSCAIDGEVASSNAKFSQISMLVENFKEEQGIVGFKAATATVDGVAWSKSIGLADIEHEVPVTSKTRFEVASVNKIFTALALQMLAEKGGIDLNAPIQKYVPQFPDKPKGTVTPDLLAGTLAGVRHYQPGERTAEYYATHYGDVDEAVGIFVNDPLVSVPGEEESYSSYGYVLLAAALQSASGTRYETLIEDLIISPLRLYDTGFVDVRIPMPGRSRLYSFRDPYSREDSNQLLVVPTMEHSSNTGAGNMYSTAEDLALLGSALLKAGFVSQRVLDTLRRPHVTRDGTPTNFSNGWIFKTLENGREVMVGGGSYPGVTSLLIVDYENDVSVAFVANTWGAGDGGVQGLLDGLLRYLNDLSSDR